MKKPDLIQIYLAVILILLVTYLIKKWIHRKNSQNLNVHNFHNSYCNIITKNFRP